MSNGSLANRVALVTGSGRGIGRSIALKLASAGASVVVNDLDDNVAQGTVQDIVAAGGRAVSCAGNVTDIAFPERFIDTAVRQFGGIDIIVNNAGYTWDSVVQKMSDEQWDAILDVHLRAPFRILRAAQPVISAAAKLERQKGEIRTRKVVNISSIAGLDGNAGQANYSAAKAGMVGLTKTLAKEWGRYSVTVNCVAFGVIRTRLTEAAAGQASIEVEGREIKVGLNPDMLREIESDIPLGRTGTPEDGANAVYLFCTPESDYISGETIICGGGYRL